MRKFRVWHKKKAAWISDEAALSMDAMDKLADS